MFLMSVTGLSKIVEPKMSLRLLPTIPLEFTSFLAKGKTPYLSLNAVHRHW